MRRREVLVLLNESDCQVCYPSSEMLDSELPALRCVLEVKKSSRLLAPFI